MVHWNRNGSEAGSSDWLQVCCGTAGNERQRVLEDHPHELSQSMGEAGRDEDDQDSMILT